MCSTFQIKKYYLNFSLFNWVFYPRFIFVYTHTLNIINIEDCNINIYW